jgi:hypothetical protein
MSDNLVALRATSITVPAAQLPALRRALRASARRAVESSSTHGVQEERDLWLDRMLMDILDADDPLDHIGLEMSYDTEHDADRASGNVYFSPPESLPCPPQFVMEAIAAHCMPKRVDWVLTTDNGATTIWRERCEAGHYSFTTLEVVSDDLLGDLAQARKRLVETFAEHPSDALRGVTATLNTAVLRLLADTGDPTEPP